MKILKLRNDFKKMPDKNWADYLKINSMLDLGWKHVSRKEYKDFYGIKETVSPIVDATPEKKKGKK